MAGSQLCPGGGKGGGEGGGNGGGGGGWGGGGGGGGGEGGGSPGRTTVSTFLRYSIWHGESDAQLWQTMWLPVLLLPVLKLPVLPFPVVVATARLGEFHVVPGVL